MDSLSKLLQKNHETDCHSQMRCGAIHQTFTMRHVVTAKHQKELLERGELSSTIHKKKSRNFIHLLS